MKNFIMFTIIAFIAMLLTIFVAYQNDKVVENYCSVAHQHSVADYKACRELTQSQLIMKLTKDFNKKTEIPELEVIK